MRAGSVATAVGSFGATAVGAVGVATALWEQPQRWRCYSIAGPAWTQFNEQQLPVGSARVAQCIVQQLVLASICVVHMFPSVSTRRATMH
eukprot:9429546-Lingulodinium_polyedra.AAC.1